MVFELINALSGIGFGTLFGFLSGLIPSLHINQIMPFVSSLLGSQELYFCVLLSSVLYVCLSFIPAYFFMVPTDANYLSVLPGQEYFKKGKAFAALVITLKAILVSAVFSLPFVVLIIFYSKKIISFYPYIIVPVLSLCFLFLVIKKTKNIYSIVVVILASCLGYVCLTTEIVSNPLFVLVGGLFGLSSAITLFYYKTEWIKQSDKTEKAPGLIKNGIIANFLSLLVTFFPGLGSGFAAFLGKELKLFKEKTDYLQIIGGVGVCVMLLSFVNIYFTGKARTGTAYYLPLNVPWYYTYLLTIIFVIAGVIITYYIGKLFVRLGNKIGNKIKFVIPVILFVLAAISTNLFGIFIFVLCGLTGYICIVSNNSRTLLMAGIIVPVLIFFI
ncbi:MAG: tripartite tricarboxylate transporter permease [Candidatus ainarchaeum sp.]|nr:tripartite tricarboxylate transporter permease [Candidatus ainarchaeum sp.]